MHNLMKISHCVDGGEEIQLLQISVTYCAKKIIFFVCLLFGLKEQNSHLAELTSSSDPYGKA